MIRQRGDTIVEVILAVTIFSLVAVGGMAVMNQGTAAAQRALEIGLVRSQIDAQADALRYAHNAYVSSLGSGDSEAKTVWNNIARSNAVTSSQTMAEVSNGRDCLLPDPVTLTRPTGFATSNRKPFAIDTRKLDGKNTVTPSGPLTVSDPTITYSSIVTPIPISSTTLNDANGFPVTYSQVRYKDAKDATTDAVAQGIWIQAVYTKVTGTLGFYDFNIKACWLSPGQQAPVTLGTVVRLYDPEA